MNQFVQSGPFGGCTKAQLEAVRAKFTAEADSFNSGLTAASINGQSYQFTAPDGLQYTRAEYWEELKAAFCQVGETKYGLPAPRTTRARF